jgi:ubiquinone/menaquinone biosynthesis C-methylase UbiE
MTEQSLPLPPPEMRRLVGPSDPKAFDNPAGAPVLPGVPVTSSEEVLDFGCGCGRLARQFIQQRPRPRRYVGIDLNRSMIQWCADNLTPHAPGFEFHHHDVYNYQFNPGPGKPETLPLPAPDSSFTLAIAWSVFTHLTEPQAAHYLREMARILRPGGVLFSTWFLFDKRTFPMPQSQSNALYTTYIDPSAAVLFDQSWVTTQARAVGLVMTAITPPAFRGYQWAILMAPRETGMVNVDFPVDDAPFAAPELVL